jgi:hypothetical protein
MSHMDLFKHAIHQAVLFVGFHNLVIILRVVFVALLALLVVEVWGGRRRSNS